MLRATARIAGPLARVIPRLTLSTLRSRTRKMSDAGLTAPRTCFNADVSAARVWDSVTVELDDVKRIKAVVPGATVNDAVLAMVGGAMRRYLLSKGELPPSSLITLAPVNTRGEGASSEASGNTVSMLRFPLGTDVAGPIARLEAVHAATAESKAVQSAIGASDLTDISKFAPPATLGLAGRLATMMGVGGKGPVVFHNCLVTNVPGPQSPALHARGEAGVLVRRRAR
jgi:hypothetical protein